MMITRYRLWHLVAIPSVVLVSGCGLLGKAELIDGIPSGIAPEEVRELLMLGERDWVVIWDGPEMVSDSVRPAYHSLTAVIECYHHLNVEGTLYFHFIDGKLTSTNFRPKDLERYRSLVEKRYGVRFVPRYNTHDGRKRPGATPVEWTARRSFRSRIEIRFVDTGVPGKKAASVKWFDYYYWELELMKGLLS